MKARELRKSEAVERKAIYTELSPSQKLARIDERLGKGVGAQKERQRLLLFNTENLKSKI